MDVFHDAVEIESKKVYQIQALYNNDSTLEFVIQPDSDYILPNGVFLNFAVNIDGHYIMDNQADKLFDSVDVILNNEKVTNRSNTNEYFLSSFFQTKANYPGGHFTNVLGPEGWWNARNYNANEIVASKMVDDMTETQVIKNNVVESRLYHYSMQIHSPLFQQLKPLPSGVSIQINFKRSKAVIPVLKVVSEADSTYDTEQIKLMDPYLEVTSIKSERLNRKLNLNTKSVLEYPIQMGVIRTHTIDDGINHVKFNCTTGGKLPTRIYTGLLDPLAYQGHVAKCATSFRRYGCKSIELFVDNKPLPGSKVKVASNNYVNAYTQFLHQCKFLSNNFCGTPLTLNEYTQTNFITAYDMTEVDLENGWLSVELDFDEITDAKILLVVYMVFDKCITFDKYRSVTME